MKIITKKVIFIFLIFNFLQVNWDFSIYDWWRYYDSIDNIENSNWNNKLWYFWSSYSWTISEYDKALALWFFDLNKSTKIIKEDPEYNWETWYFWSSYSWIISEYDKILPLWIFDLNKSTKIIKEDPFYSSPIWFFNDFEIIEEEEEVIDDSISKKEESTITYYDYFSKIYNNNLVYTAENWAFSYYEYNKFISNLNSLFLDNYNEK